MVSRIKIAGKFLLFMLTLLLSFESVGRKPKIKWENETQPAIMSVTMVMIHDVINPPAASRFYSYMMLSAQYIASQESNYIPSLSVLVKGFPEIKLTKQVNAQNHLAALYSLLETAKLMLPSGFQLESDQKKMLLKWEKEGISENEIVASVELAKQVSKEVVAWAKLDGYFKLSALQRYRPIKGKAYWYPTPPAYMEAVEPNWRTIRPMVIDSANQFRPIAPAAYSEDPSSDFYRLTKQVYETSKSLSSEQKLMAAFWDCNPFAINTSGHMSIGFKKMSPGGHWMNITGIASKASNLPFDKAIFLHSIVAITLRDAFISCWDEKYTSNRIRPETAIQRLLDIHWQPLLQTPPFPEYTSGHSVISTATAEVLTYFLGDSFSYLDDSEIYFDLKPRSFQSFRQAANEAAISRLYGGIHFFDAIEQGQTQGKKIGEYIISRLKSAQIKEFNQ